jgi:putative NADH-flavin reductase
MNIIVFGAAGDVGRRIVAEAVTRGHRVAAVVRREQGAQAFDSSVEVLVRDVASAEDLADKIAERDAMITALRPPAGDEPSLVPLTRAVVEAARRANARYIVVGGAAVLLIPDGNGHTVLTAPGFLPEEVVPIATACQSQYDWCVDRLHPTGTHICPPAMMTPGERTGSYRLGSDTLVTDGNGESQISMEDFAVAILDEVETPRHLGVRFTVGY